MVDFIGIIRFQNGASVTVEVLLSFNFLRVHAGGPGRPRGQI